jgi:hypothetical protein
MTYAPAALKAAQTYLRSKTGLDWVSLGIIGDEDHRGGYHCGWDRRRIVEDELADYAWEESSRDSGHRTEASAALDVGYFSKGGKTLRTFSVWLVEQCKAGAVGTRDIREVIYSPDGRTVKRWDRLGKRTSGDDSHLSHTHISYHRDAEARDKVGLFKRYFEPEATMAITDADVLKIWGYTNPSLTKMDAYAILRDKGLEQQIRAEQSKQTALLQQVLAAQSDLTEAEIAAAVKAGVEAALPSVSDLAAAVAAAVDHELDTAAVEAALRTVLGSVDGVGE